MGARFHRRREANMTHILLTHGYFLAEDEKERQIMKPYPPLGLLYLSAYLKSRGHSVEVYDSTFGTRPELLQKIRGAPGGIVGIYTNLMTRGSVKSAGWENSTPQLFPSHL
jgi:anaerobic magnesium-protoporphyrin IX monomethyl ester cyclase